jgi:hypothetical protein
LRIAAPPSDGSSPQAGCCATLRTTHPIRDMGQLAEYRASPARPRRSTTCSAVGCGATAPATTRTRRSSSTSTAHSSAARRQPAYCPTLDWTGLARGRQRRAGRRSVAGVVRRAPALAAPDRATVRDALSRMAFRRSRRWGGRAAVPQRTGACRRGTCSSAACGTCKRSRKCALRPPASPIGRAVFGRSPEAGRRSQPSGGRRGVRGQRQCSVVMRAAGAFALFQPRRGAAARLRTRRPATACRRRRCTRRT